MSRLKPIGPAIAGESPEPSFPWPDPAIAEKIRFYHMERRMSREKLAFIYGKSTVQAVFGG